MLDTYKHGVYAELGASEITPADESDSVVVAVVTAPVNLSADPQVNTPIKIASMKDAVKFGYSTSEDFSSNKMIDAALKINQIAPIYLINVLDPEVHKGETKTVTLQFYKDTALLQDDKAIVSSFKLEDRTEGVDYKVQIDNGDIYFSLIEPKKAGGNQEIVIRPKVADVHAKSGITLENYELKLAEGAELDPSLIHGDSYYAGVQFLKPEGAVSVDVYRDGEPYHLGIKLDQEFSDEDSVFEGEYTIYLRVADVDGGRTEMGTYDYSFEWTMADGSTTTTNAVINRVPAKQVNGNGTLTVTYETVDPTKVTKTEIIGTADEKFGSFTGLQSINVLIQKYGLTPNNISLYCPYFGEDPEVYQALLDVTPLNGHYYCYVYTDIPLENNVIPAAINWKLDNQDSEFSSTHWPYVIAKDKKAYPLGMIAMTAQLALDATNDDIPFESISNKDVPIISQYFGEDSKNYGFDQHTGNALNEQGIITNVFYGGRQTVWGTETANVKDGEPDDARGMYTTAIRMQMYLVNDFQNRFASKIDKPLSRSLIQEILSEERIFLDTLEATGAIYGVEFGFHETKNTSETAMNGHFYFKMADSPAIPVPYLHSEVSYSDRWYSTLLDEE